MMKLLLPLASCAALAQASVWPLPSSSSYGDNVLWIDRDVEVSCNGVAQVLSPRSDSDSSRLGWESTYTYQATLQSYASTASNKTASRQIVANAVQRTFDTLFTKNFVPWKFHPRFSDFEPEGGEGRIMVKKIVLCQNATDRADILKPVTGEVDESYTLDMTAEGDVTITAVSSIGLLYGLTTLTQLFYQHTDGGVYTSVAPVSITDSPKFPWRGLNVDTSRTFKPMTDMYRTIDALSYVKMNRLHWHVTDAQSWPLEIPAFPELADKGAYASFQKYSPADVRALQDYGALLGVQVIMEIDQPGHTSSIWFSHPELIAAFNVQPDWDTVSGEPPSGTMLLNSSLIPPFLQTLFDDLLPRLKPRTSYFHLGGDEVNANAYNLDPTVGTNDTSILQPLMQKFMDRNLAQLSEHNFLPIVWEEMLLTWNLTLPKDILIQSWQSTENVALITAAGHKVITGNYNFWYLDCGYGQWVDFSQETAAANFPWQDYCAPRHNWRVVYSYDPLDGVPANQTHLVLGGEVHIWSEQTDSVTLDTMVWPRAAAAGEVLWSGAKDATGRNRSQIEASPRLAEMRERLVARGVRSEPVHMPFCTMNGTQCAL